jgi:hypothetical protein
MPKRTPTATERKGLVDPYVRELARLAKAHFPLAAMEE